MLDKRKIPFRELKKLFQAGDEEAIAIMQELAALIGKSLESEIAEMDSDTKTIFDYGMMHINSDNPIHRAFVANMSKADIYEAGKALAEENKKRLDPPTASLNIGNVEKPQKVIQTPTNQPGAESIERTENKLTKESPAGLFGGTIQQIAQNTTSNIAGEEYDQLSVAELKHKAARFDVMRYGKSAQVENLQESASPDQLPDRKKELDALCIKWVNRGYMPKNYNQSEFLAENQDTFITVTEFKRALKDACRRGKIAKNPNTKRFEPIT